MGKAASKKNIARAQEAHAAAPDALGPRLGVLVYQSRVPAAAVGALLHVSVPTLYRWFFGTNEVAAMYLRRVGRLCGILTRALETEALPAVGTLDQRVQILADIIRAELVKPNL